MLKRAILIVIILVASLAIVPQVKAQCSMCAITADQGSKNGNTQSKGLNTGVVYLMSIPYLLIAGVGFLWYRNYRKKVSSTSVKANN